MPAQGVPPTLEKSEAQESSSNLTTFTAANVADDSRQNHELDQKYTSIHKMQFDEASEQMIEEDIDSQSYAYTPSNLNKQPRTVHGFEDHMFSGGDRTFSHLVTSNPNT